MSAGRLKAASLFAFCSIAGLGFLILPSVQLCEASPGKTGRSFTPPTSPRAPAGDYNGDGRVDLDDHANWSLCVTGPGNPPYPVGCQAFDVESDGDVDLVDFSSLQIALTWCQQDAVCDDGLFCNGAEVCSPATGTCDPGSFPCTPLETCDEIDDVCELIDVCGNGMMDEGEDCDDGNHVDGDGCDSNCTVTKCGNGIVTAGEECDDGNEVSGDGCDATCHRETPGPVNDYCANAAHVFDGTTSINTFNATTDGPAEPTCGFIYEDPQIGSDVWFHYTSTCTGDLVLSLCGSVFDTKMAVYDEWDCPTGTPIACSNDDCGNSVASRVEVQATPGQLFLIRVGGFMEVQGVGQINILCNEQVCGEGNGDCMQGNDTPGCDEADCCEITCSLDPYCCDFMWDQYCADEAAGLCTGSFDACAAGAGSCSETNHSAGCEDVDCCNTVCMQDPFCCVETWDDTCAEEAFNMCFLACGDQSGSCFSANASPGCSDETCCETVCTIDRFCCETLWDQECANLAATECPQ